MRGFETGGEEEGGDGGEEEGRPSRHEQTWTLEQTWKHMAEELFALVRSGDFEGLRALLSSGAASASALHADHTARALHEAALHGRLECVRVLLEAGAAVDAPDVGGSTPLFSASVGAHPQCIRVKCAVLLRFFFCS